MKTYFAVLFAVLFSVTGLSSSAKADSDDVRNYDSDHRSHSEYIHRDRPHLTWVHRHFILVNGHRVFWVPGHPAVR